MGSEKQVELANHEIVTLAVYLVGGEARPVDTEDVAMKAAELAPGRFSWRKYPKQINIESVRKRLWDATKAERGLLIGSERQGWQLTVLGAAFAHKQAANLSDLDLARPRVNKAEQKWIHSERTRLLASDAFLTVSKGSDDEVTRQQAEAFFRLDAYVTGQARARKIARIVNAFGDDPELGDAVRTLAELLGSGE